MYSPLRVLFWVAGGGELNEDVYTWIAAGSFKAAVGFQVDALSTIMIVTVTTISFLIHVYSFGYMRNDPGFARFFAYLNLFVFSMLVLGTREQLSADVRGMGKALVYVHIS